MSLNINNMRKPWSREETIVLSMCIARFLSRKAEKRTPSYDITPRYSAEVPVP